MENILFIFMSSFLPLALLNLFADGNSSLAQSQQGRPQGNMPQSGSQGGLSRTGSSLNGLEIFSLPDGPISEDDVPGIRTIIEAALNKISETVKTAGKKSNNQTIRSSILTFQNWLKAQKCVTQSSSSYDIDDIDKYAENIFFTYPGQVPFDITFNFGEGNKKPYRLLIFVTPADLFNFGSLVENKTINGVPALKNWPSEYLQKTLDS